MSAYYSQSITRMNGYSEGTSMSLAKLPIGFSYLNVVDSSDFPSKSGAVLKFKFGGTMYPDLGDCIKLYEDCYTKCIICADGSVLTQLELADSLIEYALLGNFDKAVVVNSYLFGDRKMLHYAILKTMAEVLSNPPKNCKNRSTYLMKDKNTGLVKIGSSSDISVRIQTLSCGNPYLSILAVLDKNIEKELHLKFADKKIKGEFYNLTNEDVSHIIKKYGFTSYVKSII